MKPKLTLPRAYLRMSPNLDQHPDPGGMVLLICAANRQPQRGRFRDRETLVRVLGRARLTRLLTRQDIVLMDGGGFYVEGWDEWQEGDLTVGERQARIRNRKRDLVTAESRPDNEPIVTPPLLDRAAPSEAVDVSSHEERSPLPPTRGGRRANGTNPRSIASKLTRDAEEADRQRKWRRQQRYLAYSRGQLTEAQRDDMDDRDAPLDEIPVVLRVMA